MGQDDVCMLLEAIIFAVGKPRSSGPTN